MDEFIDDLLREERVNDVILPRIQKRHILEEANEIEPRVSLLEADDLDEDIEVIINHVKQNGWLWVTSSILVSIILKILSFYLQDDDEEEENVNKNKARRAGDDEDYMHSLKRYDDGTLIKIE